MPLRPNQLVTGSQIRCEYELITVDHPDEVCTSEYWRPAWRNITRGSILHAYCAPGQPRPAHVEDIAGEMTYLRLIVTRKWIESYPVARALLEVRELERVAFPRNHDPDNFESGGAKMTFNDPSMLVR